jgi:hypothetical protein
MSKFTEIQQNALDVIANGKRYEKNVQEAYDFLAMMPAVGMPATYFIGSDCYAYEVAEIVYFKTGAKAGQPKMIIAKSENRIETFTRTKRGFQMSYGDHFGGFFQVGSAKEYRDPSF